MPRTLDEVMQSLPADRRKAVEDGAAQMAADYDHQRAAQRSFILKTAALAQQATTSGISTTIVVSTNTGDVQIRTPRDALQLRNKVLMRA